MDLSELEKFWTSPGTDKGDVQRQIWDRAAEDYYKKPLPDFETDPFLRQLVKQFPLDTAMRCLDIGCGAGRYTMALAPRVKEAVGVDISPRMIRFAEKVAREHGLDNTHFQCLDWAEADIDKLGLRNSFDLVFAHMTPAVSDFTTFDKLNACSRRWCIVEKPSRRRDLVLDAALNTIGFRAEDTHSDSGVPYAFAYLWSKGYTPSLDYRREEWRVQRTEEDMVSWCVDRARLCRDITASEESAIRDLVSSFSDEGKTEEIVTTTIVTIFWEIL